MASILNSSVLFAPTSVYTGYGGTVTTFSSKYMTTQFTPPPSCATRDWTLRASYPNTVQAMWDYDFNSTKTLNSCSDSVFVEHLAHVKSYYDRGQPQNTGFFQDQPVTGVCPAGYVTVATRTPGSVDAYYIYQSTNPVQVLFTEAWCCPQGYTAQLTHSNPHSTTDATFTCNSFVQATATVSVAVYGGYPTLAVQSYSTKVISSFTAQDRGYYVKWNALQVPYIQPSEARPVSTSNSGVISFGKQPTSTNNSGSGGGDSSGDSNDYVPYLGPRLIGAIVGSVVGAVLSITLSAICLCRRRRKAREAQANMPTVDNAHYDPVQKPGSTGIQEMETQANMPTVDNTNHYAVQKPVSAGIQEMETRHQIAELAFSKPVPVPGGDASLAASFELPAEPISKGQSDAAAAELACPIPTQQVK